MAMDELERPDLEKFLGKGKFQTEDTTHLAKEPVLLDFKCYEQLGMDIFRYRDPPFKEEDLQLFLVREELKVGDKFLVSWPFGGFVVGTVARSSVSGFDAESEGLFI